MKKTITVVLFFFLASCHVDKPVPPVYDATIVENDTTGGRYTEVVIAAKAFADYQEGDIVDVRTAKSMLRRAIQARARYEIAPRNADGYMTKESFAYIYSRFAYKYRIQRISDFAIERIEQTTGKKDTLSNMPNSQGEYIDVPLWLKRRKKKNIFGTVGLEEWFGGYRKLTFANMDSLAGIITQKKGTTKKRVLRKLMKHFEPFDSNFLQKYIVLRVIDVSHIDSRKLVEPDTIIVGSDTTVTDRRWKITVARLAQLLGKSEEEVRSMKDAREIKTFSLKNLVERK